MARLLIVDDHRTWAEVLAHALSEIGHEVVGHCWMADQVTACDCRGVGPVAVDGQP